MGAETKASQEKERERVYWEGLLSKNPSYAPGWNEIGRVDKVKEIDPNFISP